MCELIGALMIQRTELEIGSQVYTSGPEAMEDNSALAALKSCLLDAGIASEQIVEKEHCPSQYDALNYQWNTIHGLILPLAYLVSYRVQDVQIAVRCCKAANVRLVPRSGGHSFAKYGYGDSSSLVIDLQNLNRITVDKESRTAWVEAGARLGRIYSKLLLEEGFTTALGQFPAVGVSGFSLNGGYGYFARMYGMASDNVLEFEMVDHNGEILIANKIKNPDLYWALRGGGAGSFGIVTRFKFKLHEAPKQVVYGRYFYDLAELEEFFPALQRLITNPGTPTTFTRIRGPNVIRLEVFDMQFEEWPTTGDSQEEMKRVLADFPKPINGTIDTMTYEEFLVKIIGQNTGFSNVSKPADLEEAIKYESVSRTTLKSFYVDRVIGKEDTRKLKSLTEKFVGKNHLFIEHFGGAINDLQREETAFVHRGSVLYNVALLAVNTNGNESDIREGEELLHEFFEETKKFFHHTESYQNYPDETSPNYLQRYYGANLKKLVEVKNRIDPDNMFCHPQSIPTAFPK